MSAHTLSLPGAPCESCWGTVRTALQKLPELQNIEVGKNPDPNMPGGIVELTIPSDSNLSIEDVQEHIDDVGFEAILISSQDMQEELENKKSSILSSHLIRFLISFGTGLPLLILSALGVTLPLYAMWAIAAVSLTSVLYAGWDVFESGIKNVLMTGKPTMHTLFSVSVITASIISIAALFFPMLPFEFSSALLILSSHHIGKYFETKMKSNVSSSRDFKSRLPQTVTRIRKNQDLSVHYETINISDIKIGDIIELQANDYLPVDGTLQTQQATFNKTFYNGNLLPEKENKNAPVYAGTQVLNDKIELLVTSDINDSSLTKWEKKLKEAQQSRNKTDIEKIADNITKYFTPGVLVVSAVIFGTALPFFGPMVALHCALGILVGACPCALGFITPLAIHVSREKSKEYGAIINNPECVEKANKANKVVIDFNGTLTKGIPTIEKMTCINKQSSCSKNRALKAIALLETSLETKHPIGEALLKFAQKNNKAMSLNSKLDHINTKENCVNGLSGLINGTKYHLGNAAFMAENNISVVDEPNRQFLAKDSVLFSYFDVIDPLRTDALLTIDRLKELGLEPILASGASEKTVEENAKLLGINTHHANCRSDEKAELIKLFQDEGHVVAMIGDGINDAIALEQADIGIALDNADELNKETADVIIHKDALLPASHFFKNCQQTVSVIKQNLIFNLIYNSAIMGLTMITALCFGPFAPAIMALSMGVLSLLTLANTYRLKLMPISLEDTTSTLEADIIEQASSNNVSDVESPTTQTKSCCCASSSRLFKAPIEKPPVSQEEPAASEVVNFSL